MLWKKLMNTDHIIEISKGKYVNINTGKSATKKEVKCFKENVINNKILADKRRKIRNNKHLLFIDSHKEILMELLDLEDDELEALTIEHIIHRLSTCLFDCFDSSYKFELLDKIRKNLGEDIYFKVIEGYVLGEHST